MILKKLKPCDRDLFFAMEDDFYHSDAVLAPVPEENICRTFDLLIVGSPFADARMVELDGETVGYILLSFTWSNEAGGITVLIEELFIRPEYRDRGIGGEVIHRVLAHYRSGAARFRLEVEDDNTGAKKLYRKIGFTDLPYRQMYIDQSIK